MNLIPALHAPRHRQRGFFLVVVLLIIASAMLIYIAANGRRLTTLKREIQLVEQSQRERLATSSATNRTNQISAIPAPATP